MVAAVVVVVGIGPERGGGGGTTVQYVGALTLFQHCRWT